MGESLLLVISATLLGLIVASLLIYRINNFYREKKFYLKSREALKPELSALKKKYKLAHSLRENALKRLQTDCTYLERFELLKIIFYNAEYFQYSHTLLYIFFENLSIFFKKFSTFFEKGMDWFF
jgi:hypothetical protein